MRIEKQQILESQNGLPFDSLYYNFKIYRNSDCKINKPVASYPHSLPSRSPIDASAHSEQKRASSGDPSITLPDSSINPSSVYPTESLRLSYLQHCLANLSRDYLH